MRPSRDGDIGAFVVRRVMHVDGGDAVDDLADAPGELARRELAFLAER